MIRLQFQAQIGPFMSWKGACKGTSEADAHIGLYKFGVLVLPSVKRSNGCSLLAEERCRFLSHWPISDRDLQTAL